MSEAEARVSSEEATLLTLKTEEGALGQGTLVAFRLKKTENQINPQSLQKKNSPIYVLILELLIFRQ